ncbi:hypothetical protein SAMN02745671_01017 [Anaerovibrio lipolyticus DSM 3074]|uniref:Uncharacterized protein n=1 Tax=Anaerovibrio lipolyticus DSM 3074 TaxID=1120997 RepID=A0A1M6C6K6_9FIRM|nr:hypothetical protein [Anaerovibrio lipolyticus]SHI56404.1 hypothetical protein SAMN02745671_01017 [Anaerovibrio lipolyticus DSM 3074]
MTREDKGLATGVNSGMKQQEGMLDKIDNLIKVCKENNLLEGVTAEELGTLACFSMEMRDAVNIAKKLAKNLLDVCEAEEKKKQAEEKDKKEAEKKAAKEKEKASNKPEEFPLEFSFDE